MKKETKTAIVVGGLVWFGVAFIIGVGSTIAERDPISDKDAPRSGCVYKSLASYLSPGYVVACELFRKRFEKEGFTK